MSVTTHHPLYNGFLKRWCKVEDVYNGQQAVKDGGQTYLKRTGGHIAAELAGKSDLAQTLYDNYKHRAQLPDVFTPSVIGLTALASRTPWTIDVPPAMNYLKENASDGVPLDQMQSKLLHDGLRYGRLGHFIDSDPSDNELRIALYKAKSIVNWKRDQNRTHLIVLKEEHETDRENIFTHESESHYRVLVLVPTKNEAGEITNWNYRVRVYTPVDGSGEYVMLDGDEFEMEDFQEQIIPFTFQGSTGLEVDPDIIPLEGMIDHVLKYYELSADLYHDIHMSNTSTGVALGFEPEDISFAGAGSMIITSKGPTEADFKFVSTDGKGQKSAMAMMDKQVEAAEKQSHRMTEKTAGVEASSTLSQKSFTKTATLRSVEEQALNSLLMDLRYIARMKGLNPDSVSVTSQYSYTEKEIDAVLLTAISNATVAGNLPKDASIEYVKSSNMYPSESREDLIERVDGEQEAIAAATVGMFDGVDSQV